MFEPYLIVGLGNPGREYEFTRHNLGFLAVRALAQKKDLEFKTSSFTKGLLAEGKIQGTKLYLFLPMTFMNHSGAAVKDIIANEHIPLKNVLIVCDDLNLAFGQMRLRPRGSEGGHNGLSSVIEHLESEGFARLRLGIGPAGRDKEVVEFVLSEFTKREKKSLKSFTEMAAQCCLTWFTQGINKAMEIYNRREGK